MITDIALVIVIIFLISLIAYLIWEHRLEKAKLLNAILSKKPEDMVNMTLADQTTINVPKPEIEDPTKDLIDINDASEEQFNNYINPPKN